MGRPKEHGEQTRAALLRAAERLVEEEGVEALSVRRVADQIGTTTRAVYSLFGSKAGLISALGTLAFDWLTDGLDALPLTDDPCADLVEAGAVVFRGLVADHPSLFRIGIQGAGLGPGVDGGVAAAADKAMARLVARVERLPPGGTLRGRPVREAAFEFHALCEGLAVLELRGTFTTGCWPDLWRNALGTLVTGLSGT